MLELFAALSACLACPDGTHYYYDQSFNFTAKPQTFFYFYTNVPREQDKPVRLQVKSPFPVKLAVDTIINCPNETSTPFLETEGGNKWYVGETHFRAKDLSVIAIGIYSDEEQVVHVKMLDQKKIRNSRIVFFQLLVILAAMLIAGGIFFCYVVLPPPNTKKEKQD